MTKTTRVNNINTERQDTATFTGASSYRRVLHRCVFLRCVL
nr:MAG TPA_asm: hypothetical protein [Caudoviricetes sp.]